jgi:hypothetical protein
LKIIDVKHIITLPLKTINSILKISTFITSIGLLDLKLPMQSVPITTSFVGSNRVHGEVYSIQHYVIKFVSDLRQVGSFFPGNTVYHIMLPPGQWYSGMSLNSLELLHSLFLTNKPDRHDITEILLKVSLNNIPPLLFYW